MILPILIFAKQLKFMLIQNLLQTAVLDWYPIYVDICAPFIYRDILSCPALLDSADPTDSFSLDPYLFLL